MDRALRVALCLAGLLWLCTQPAQAQRAFKLGGGIHFDEDTPGFNLAIDIPFGKGDVAFSPFADLFFKSGSNVIGAGINLVIKRPVGENGKIYFGGGGGVGHIKSEAEFPTGTGGNFARASASKTQGMANGVFGLEYAASSRASIFAQGKWIGMFGGSDETAPLSQPLSDGSTTIPVDLAVKSFAFQVGLSFNFGQVYDDY